MCVRRAINDEMKIAASHALAKLAKEDVPDSVIRAYGGKRIEFGREYIIPKPFDPRVLLWETVAVAQGGDGYRRRAKSDRGHGGVQGQARSTTGQEPAR